MKLLLTSFLMLLGAFGSINAQTFQFGVRAGANVSFGSETSTCYGQKVKPGVNVGLVGVCNISNAFAIEANLMYAMLNTEDSLRSVSADADEIVKHTSTVHGIDIPILAKVRLVEGLSIEAGPQFGFLVGGKEKLGGAKRDADIDNVFQFSLAGGLCYNFNEHFSVDARYVHTFTKQAPYLPQKRSVQLSVAYLF